MVAHRFELRPINRDHGAFDYVQARHPAHFSAILSNASDILQATFAESETVAVVLRAFGGRRNRLRVRSYSSQPTSRWRFRRKGICGRGGALREAIVQAPLGAFDWSYLFRAIAGQDFPPSRPRLHGQAFVFSLDRSRLLYHYDDRGLIVAAPTLEGLPQRTDQQESLQLEMVSNWRPPSPW